MTLVQVLLLQGTHGWTPGANAGCWWHPDSPFVKKLATVGIVPVSATRPFVWSTAIDGLSGSRHPVWVSAGLNLYAYFEPPLRLVELPVAIAPPRVSTYIPPADRIVIAHSHGGQVIAEACAAGLEIGRLLTIGSPVREDMMRVYAAARPNIGSHMHIHSDDSDAIQLFGALFDGHLGVVREHPFADKGKNILIAKVGHTSLLNGSDRTFEILQAHGAIDFLRTPVPPLARTTVHPA